MTELSDELLVAYVDGQLARKQTQAVERVLEQDDVIAKRVVALKHAHSRLETAFEAILAGEEEDAASKPPAIPPGLYISWPTLAKSALASAGLVLAFILMLAGFGWPLQAPEFSLESSVPADPDYVGALPSTWQEDAARAHALFSRASVEVGLESQGNADLVAFQLAQAIGPNLVVPDLAPQGFRFMRAQLLRSGKATPLAQLLYLGKRGAPLALYAQAGEGTAAPAFKQYGSIGGVAWSQSGLAYLLAGEADEASLRKLANAIRTEKGASAKAPSAFSPLPPPPKPKPKPRS
jgi:anti-sigma factor RsiW